MTSGKISSNNKRKLSTDEEIVTITIFFKLKIIAKSETTLIVYWTHKFTDKFFQAEFFKRLLVVYFFLQHHIGNSHKHFYAAQCGSKTFPL